MFLVELHGFKQRGYLDVEDAWTNLMDTFIMIYIQLLFFLPPNYKLIYHLNNQFDEKFENKGPLANWFNKYEVVEILGIFFPMIIQLKN